jgi:hypothetical protein
MDSKNSAPVMTSIALLTTGAAADCSLIFLRLETLIRRRLSQ